MRLWALWVPALLMAANPKSKSTVLAEETTNPPGVMDWFGIVQTFLGTLHGIMQEGAGVVREKDPNAAADIEMFEYNWLSILGYSKGILPLITDFYFNYFRQEPFIKKNGEFVRNLRNLIALFVSDGDEEEMYLSLRAIVGGSLQSNLFNDGTIKSFLGEFNSIVNNKSTCLELLKLAKQKAADISGFLHFILKGTPKREESARPSNSEL